MYFQIRDVSDVGVRKSQPAPPKTVVTVTCPVCKDNCEDREALKLHLHLDHDCDDERVLDAAEEDIILLEQEEGTYFSIIHPVGENINRILKKPCQINQFHEIL